MSSFDDRLTVRSAGTHPSGKVSSKATEVMKEAGIDISGHKSEPVEKYLNEQWDYVITVCDSAYETCPVFSGNVKKRLHLGFDDPYMAEGSPEEVRHEFARVRDEIREAFAKFYNDTIKPGL